MKKHLLPLLMALASAVSAAGVRTAAYPYCKTVAVPAERTALFLIPIDGEIYRHTEPGQTDLRIVSPDGEQLPYAVSPLLRGWKTESSHRAVKGKIVGFDLDRTANVATVEYELADPALPVSKLRLHTEDRDFDKSVSLEFDNGSVTEKFRFFNHSGNVQFRNDVFQFPPQNTRRIRVRIHNFAEQRVGPAVLEHKGQQDTFTESRLITRELRLAEICFYTRTEELLPDPVRTVCFLPELSREKSGKDTVIRLDAGRRKITQLLFETTTPRYLREVGVRAVRREGNAVAERRFTKKIEPRLSEFPVEDFRADEYIVTIRNGDDPELPELSIVARCVEEALLIEGASAPAGTVKILYGSEKSDAPQYGLRSYVADLYGKEYQVVTASPEAANPDCRQAGFSGRSLKGAVGWIIGAAALLLAVIAWRSFSRITPEE